MHGGTPNIQRRCNVDEEIKLTKSQKMLIQYWQAEINAMHEQLRSMMKMLYNEVMNLTIDNIAVENGIDPSEYWYDINSKSFKLIKNKVSNIKKPTQADRINFIKEQKDAESGT